MCEMVENLQFNIEQAGTLFAIVVFGAIIGSTPYYNEVDDIINDFCEEYNVNMDTIIINEF